jgi:hypothetical protein
MYIYNVYLLKIYSVVCLFTCTTHFSHFTISYKKKEKYIKEEIVNNNNVQWTPNDTKSSLNQRQSYD